MTPYQLGDKIACASLLVEGSQRLEEMGHVALEYTASVIKTERRKALEQARDACFFFDDYIAIQRLIDEKMEDEKCGPL